MARRKSGLSDADQALWKQVTATAKALRPVTSKIVIHYHQPPAPATPKPKVVALVIGEATKAPIATVLPVRDPLNQSSVQMDKRSFERLRKGRLRPEARLDLHGMTTVVAHGRLNRFIVEAHEADLRLVLIITGKGRVWPEETGVMPVRKGVLRHSVPHWLAQLALKARILQVTQAHDKHGGGGALYVYLRRRRGQD